MAIALIASPLKYLNKLNKVVYIDTKSLVEHHSGYNTLIRISTSLSVIPEHADDPWIEVYDIVNFRVSPFIWNATIETTTNIPVQF